MMNPPRNLDLDLKITDYPNLEPAGYVEIGVPHYVLFTEDFTGCDYTGWTIYSSASNIDWECAYESMKATNYGADEGADDWLISPAINLNNYTK